MPNPGGIYLGCERCRQRKIKCDRASPDCRRCTIHGVPCPGYRRTRDGMFRDETMKTVRKANARAFYEDTTIFKERRSSNTLNATKEIVIWLPIHGPLRLPDTMTSTCYFMHQIVIPVGWFPLIPKLYQESRPGGCLKWAVDAASMFLYANRTGKNQLLVHARNLYSSALKATNSAISSPFESLKDETFCAILVLNIIDDITGDMSFVSGSHIEGCRALLIQREASSFASSSTSDLILSVVIQTQAQILRNHHQPTPGSLQWLSRQHSGTLAAMVLAECINIQQLRLCSFDVLSCSLDKLPDDTSWWTCVLDTVDSIDVRLEQMVSRFGGRWDIHTTFQPTQAGDSTALDYYQDIQAAKIWNQRRTTRIALHEFLLEVSERFQVPHQVKNRDDMKKLRGQSVEVIKSMSSEICASIPFHLRKIDADGRECSSDAQQVAGASALVWPLETIAKCRYNGGNDRLVARATLEEIGHAIGVRQATRRLPELYDQDPNSLFTRPWQH